MAPVNADACSKTSIRPRLRDEKPKGRNPRARNHEGKPTKLDPQANQVPAFARRGRRHPHHASLPNRLTTVHTCLPTVQFLGAALREARAYRPEGTCSTERMAPPHNQLRNIMHVR